MHDSTVAFAIIGQGYIGKRHAEVIRNNPAARLVAVCDIAPKEELGLAGISEPFYTDIAEMLACHPDIEVVNICTPNGLHAAHSLLALNAGKHVVCEKPLALSVADAEAVRARAAAVDKRVFCVMQNRFSPPAVWLKEVIKQKVLGDIYMVQLNCYWNRDDRYYQAGGWKGTETMDGGTLFTQFWHFIDLLLWLFGDVTEIEARFDDFVHANLTEFEDSGLVNFRLVNGGMGTFTYSTAVWDQNLESSLTVIGSNGSLKVGGQYMDIVEYCHIRDYTMPALVPTNPANDYGSYKGSANNHEAVIQNVIDVLRNQAIVAAPVAEGLRVVEMIRRIYALRGLDRKS